MEWWGLPVICQKCDKEADPQFPLFRANGQLLFLGYCPQCREFVKKTVYASDLVWMASKNDADKEKKANQQPGEPIPPLHPSRPLRSRIRRRRKLRGKTQNFSQG